MQSLPQTAGAGSTCTPRVCVPAATWHIDRLGQLGEFEQDSNTDSEQESSTALEQESNTASEQESNTDSHSAPRGESSYVRRGGYRGTANVWQLPPNETGRRCESATNATQPWFRTRQSQGAGNSATMDPDAAKARAGCWQQCNNGRSRSRATPAKQQSNKETSNKGRTSSQSTYNDRK